MLWLSRSTDPVFSMCLAEVGYVIITKEIQGADLGRTTADRLRERRANLKRELNEAYHASRLANI